MLTLIVGFVVGLIIGLALGNALGWIGMREWQARRTGMDYHEAISALAMVKMDPELLKRAREISKDSLAQLEAKRARRRKSNNHGD